MGCSGTKSSAPTAPVAHKTAPADPWVLTCLDPNEPNPALLWNGQIGIRIGRDARASGSMLMIDEYEITGEEKIKKVQNPVSATLVAGSNELAALEGGRWDEVTGYSQVLDMHTGILTTKWTEPIATATHPKRTVSVTCETALHPSSRIVAQRWTAIPDEGPASFELAPTIAGTTELSPRTQNGSPDETSSYAGLKGSEDTFWSVRRRDLSTGKGALAAGKPFVGELIWSIGQSPTSAKIAASRKPPVPPVKEPDGEAGFPDVQESHWAYTDLYRPKFEGVANASKAEWAKRWQTDIEIDGPVEDQQAIRSFLFYLRSAIDPNGQMSISPYGLSSAQYNGHVFWDADIWVFPALALIDPEEAKAIANYRLSRRAAAVQNFAAWFDRGLTEGTLPRSPVSHETARVKYPWESSVTGSETVFGPSRDEEHINGDVPFMLGQAATLGLIPKSDFQRAIRDADLFWMRRSEPVVDKTPARSRTSIPLPPSFSGAPFGSAHGRLFASSQEEGGTRIIRGVMSPDENHVGDNDLYTNLLAQWCVDGGTWERRLLGFHELDTHAKFKLPRDNISFLTYDNDPLKGYKQAAAVLSIYPLQYPPAEKEARVMMDRFADKVTKNGPAMSDSLHALIWARLEDTDRAYETWERSWKEFVKQPHLQFSEKRNKTSTYFTTGAAGCLQTVIYGFLGFRIDSKKQDGAQWSTPLALGKILSVRPNLPRSWKSVKFKNFTVMGKRYTLLADHSGARVTQGDK
ncbi:MAG: glycosyl hydrolase family 65 protein [Fimbriimonadales bacterium]